MQVGKWAPETGDGTIDALVWTLDFLGWMLLDAAATNGSAGAASVSVVVPAEDDSSAPASLPFFLSMLPSIAPICLLQSVAPAQSVTTLVQVCT